MRSAGFWVVLLRRLTSCSPLNLRFPLQRPATAYRTVLYGVQPDRPRSARKELDTIGYRSIAPEPIRQSGSLSFDSPSGSYWQSARRPFADPFLPPRSLLIGVAEKDRLQTLLRA
ncbi:hypothetical protein P175DRAFT_0535962 [Aspergillus ochraceoroseus IBT 24754]|uniref:Uncharacterized protein n=1 Tax=Aspergillus ochraceoroseus IBT 24754 TaxID=1392256 RepID=A0A2T5LMW7_9EURO|nr:uncharacterized protein P175DRAFT_0535962 [Aspergillus ochraceoroseus IBT 24754]PTU17623.1 hypothetical protein P175DRAFT_0535962 [Aspergillus ochraceoroseus IBT 24754]